MKIGIIGSGDVGRALASGFIKRGDDVMIGTRDTSKYAALQSEIAGVKVGNLNETAEHGELIILATSFDGAQNALKLAGSAKLSGKTLIDTTNPLQLSDNEPVSLSLGLTDSAGESIQRWAPEAHVVKAFNSVGNALMVHPTFHDGRPTMFICGNHAQAKSDVSEILQDFGWDVADVGNITESRWLEPLCILWVHFGIASGNWHQAFKLLRQ